MINNEQLVDWQIVDKENDLVMPWFTHSSLQAIKGIDLSDKIVVQLGAGLGDAWLASRCKHLYCVERSHDWLIRANTYATNRNIFNLTYIYVPINDGSDLDKEYIGTIPEEFDVLINDDAYRSEVCQFAVDYFTKKENGGIFIVDNWQQDFVWLSPRSEELLLPFEHTIYPQPDHSQNEIERWKTAIFYIK